jgi:hypothetical protein
MQLLLIRVVIMEVWSSTTNQNALPSSDVIRDRILVAIKVLVCYLEYEKMRMAWKMEVKVLILMGDNYSRTQHIPKVGLLRYCS